MPKNIDQKKPPDYKDFIDEYVSNNSYEEENEITKEDLDVDFLGDYDYKKYLYEEEENEN